MGISNSSSVQSTYVMAPSKTSYSSLGGEFATNSRVSDNSSLGVLNNYYGVKTVDSQRCIVFDYKYSYKSFLCYEMYKDGFQLYNNRFPDPFLNLEFDAWFEDQFESRVKYTNKYLNWFCNCTLTSKRVKAYIKKIELNIYKFNLTENTDQEQNRDITNKENESISEVDTSVQTDKEIKVLNDFRIKKEQTFHNLYTTKLHKKIENLKEKEKEKNELLEYRFNQKSTDQNKNKNKSTLKGRNVKNSKDSDIELTKDQTTYYYPSAFVNKLIKSEFNTRQKYYNSLEQGPIYTFQILFDKDQHVDLTSLFVAFDDESYNQMNNTNCNWQHIFLWEVVSKIYTERDYGKVKVFLAQIELDQDTIEIKAYILKALRILLDKLASFKRCFNLTSSVTFLNRTYNNSYQEFVDRLNVIQYE